MNTDVLNRFMGLVMTDTETGCWEWIGSVNSWGYGVYTYPGQTSHAAHRIAYEHWKGTIPRGLDIDHLCSRRDCVNPAHLEAVTRGENIRRSHARNPRPERTTCHLGHPFDEANTAFDKRGFRNCRICNVRRTLAYRERRRHEGVSKPASEFHNDKI